MKHILIDFAEASEGSFNWTKVELKHASIKATPVPPRAFNWTKLELKQALKEMQCESWGDF